MLTPKASRNIIRIIPFGLIWLIFSLIYSFLEKGLLGDLTFYPSTGNPYNFLGNIIITAISASISGLVVGTFEILYLSKVFSNKSLGKKIIYKTIIYIFIMISFLLINSLISNSFRLDSNVFDQYVWYNVLVFFSDFAFWSVAMYISAIIGVSLFYAEVSENLGQGVLINFFTGKYHSPKEEERIFMFLDMKSSTTIAEKLGHVKYFEILKEYYADLSDAIIDHLGEVYQYVGDEVVVSWKLKNGLNNDNWLRCFLAMKETMNINAGKYDLKFGVLPMFKAGFHVGKVTTGEIGVIKKDIIFTGDVLNTTARIQGLCNIYEVDILISNDLIKRINSTPEIKIKSLGKTELRGRDEKVELFTII